ncbi:hypothetical protein [Ottowia sp.]|mgnify:CR=1 FL=1|uniref:hypothetical protein n=1 Tax=Ottowia sp. TaxID=1898956 RepID=UPI002BAF879A|nr:hypothetical protein [Ottowia sp.]HRN77240.1 hypothetical protein [Ottowia sp.]HRQ03072.1 hypothetical protein [Ottowia sp.]
MKTLPLRVAYSLSGLLLLVLLVLGTQIRHGLEYLNEPLRGHLDAQPADFQPDGTTVIKGWAYHAAGVQAASLIVDEKRRLPLQVGLERADVAAALPGRPGAEHSGFAGEYEFGSAVHGSHTFELEVTLRDGRVMHLGPWRLDLGARPWKLPAADTGKTATPFHLSIATSHIAAGGIDGMQEKFGHYETDSMRLAVTVPVLYMRTTRGRAGDWEFDPHFDIGRKCGERTLAEDNLDTIIGNAIQKRRPTLFTLNGGVWADAACDVPDWDINDELEKTKAHVQWNERNEAVEDDYLSHLPGSIHAPELARILSYNVYNQTARAYKKRNLQSAARLIADLDRQAPELVVGINLDADTYVNPFFEGKQWFDYNPDTIRQFREWLQGTGPYAADWNSPEIPNLSSYRRRKNYSLEEVSALAGTRFASWDEVDPPRRMSVPKKFFENPWFAVWDEFRRHLIDLHYDELSQWVHEAGIPEQKIFSSQGFQAPGELINPFAIHVDSPPKNYDSGGMSVEGAVPSHGRLGAILYGPSARNDIRTESGQPLFTIFNTLSPGGWGVVEFHPADLKLPKRVPSYAESYEALNRMLTGGARFVSVMSWNGGSGLFRDQPGYVAFTVIKDSPLESAITSLLSNYGGLPRGSIVWTFGSLGATSEEGWKTTEGVGNSAFGRYHMRTSTAGRARMEHVPELRDPAPQTASALVLEVRNDAPVTLRLHSSGSDTGAVASTASLPQGTQAQTVVLPIQDRAVKMNELKLEVTGSANASIFIDRMALLP